MRSLSIALFATACVEVGGFDILDPDGLNTPDPNDTAPPIVDTKPDVPDETDETDTPDSGQPYACGLELFPPDAFLGANSRVFLGTARVRRGSGVGSWNWTGCEVERHFDSDGAWICDVVRTAKGSGSDELFTSPGVQLVVKLTVDPVATTCVRPAINLDVGYGLDVAIPFNRKVVLFRKQGANDWSNLGTFAATGTGADVRFSYGTPFAR